MNLREEKQKGLVFIDGLPIAAFIDEDLCPTCNNNKLYSYEFDAYFCIHCNHWLEPACRDPKCPHCSKRPKKPSKMLDTPEDPDNPRFTQQDNTAEVRFHK
ncbi:MAG: hypothetical protein EOM80_06610 [Erysipelotrichia bacterium]|nr:hypothetical protein [Erysipelotrichia bacterium]